VNIDAISSAPLFKRSDQALAKGMIFRPCQGSCSLKISCHVAIKDAFGPPANTSTIHPAAGLRGGSHADLLWLINFGARNYLCLF
ncbi:hypothetical protein M3P21_22390, partial [Ruegeria sp. 2012CJ41-6]